MVEGVGVSDEQLDELTDEIKKQFDLGGYFSSREHTEKAEALLYALAGEVRASHAREAEAVAALAEFTTEAVEDVDHWGSYAGDYFAEKWDLAGCLRKWRSRRETWVAALTGTDNQSTEES